MMTQQEFLQKISERGGYLAPAASDGQINLLNINLQKMHAAIIPKYMIDLYRQCNGIKLGSGYIFGASEFTYSNKHPVPNIVQINQELTNLAILRGRTVFGKNDLFWFAFDSFGICTMLDNTSLGVLRKYDDPYRAMFECLIGGKI